MSKRTGRVVIALGALVAAGIILLIVDRQNAPASAQPDFVDQDDGAPPDN